MFAYGDWQTASFVAAEMRDPRRDLVRALLGRRRRRDPLHLGSVRLPLCAWPYRACPIDDSGGDSMRMALGERGATLIALGIAISALGFLSQGMLTAPRVYFAMAEDGLFFRKVAEVNAATRVPMLAIALQCGAIAIALSGTRPDSELCRVGRFHLVRTDRLRAVHLQAAGPAKAGFSAGPPHHHWPVVLACALV